MDFGFPPVNWKDELYYSKDRIVLTKEQLRIPGVRVFARHTMQSAVSPLWPHYHENCLELTFVTKGNIIFSVEGNPYKMTGGDAFLAFPNEIHSTDQEPMSKGEIYWIQLEMTQTEDFLFLNEEAACSLREMFRNCHHKITSDNQESRRTLEQAFAMALKGENRYYTANLIVSFLYCLLNIQEQTDTRLSEDIVRSVSYIYNHLTEKITLEQLAAEAVLSVSQFKQKFKKQLGVSPRNFINYQKIEYAKTLMNSGTSMTDLAISLGFSSSSYFSVVFKKFTTYTPSEFLERLQFKESR